jgi:hypothetical protein
MHPVDQRHGLPTTRPPSTPGCPACRRNRLAPAPEAAPAPHARSASVRRSAIWQGAARISAIGLGSTGRPAGRSAAALVWRLGAARRCRPAGRCPWRPSGDRRPTTHRTRPARLRARRVSEANSLFLSSLLSLSLSSAIGRRSLIDRNAIAMRSLGDFVTIGRRPLAPPFGIALGARCLPPLTCLPRIKRLLGERRVVEASVGARDPFIERTGRPRALPRRNVTAIAGQIGQCGIIIGQRRRRHLLPRGSHRENAGPERLGVQHPRQRAVPQFRHVERQPGQSAQIAVGWRERGWNFDRYARGYARHDGNGQAAICCTFPLGAAICAGGNDANQERPASTSTKTRVPSLMDRRSPRPSAS